MMGIDFADFVQRGRVVVVHLLTLERRWLWAGGAGIALVAFIPVIWLLLSPSGRPQQTIAADELRMTVICESCGLRESLPVSKIHALPVAPNGLMVCPKCGRPALDRYRRGSPGILQVNVPAETPDSP